MASITFLASNGQHTCCSGLDNVDSLSLFSPAGIIDKTITSLYHELLGGDNIFQVEEMSDFDNFLQMKHSLKLAGDNGKLGGYFEKITNFAQSIAKTIRSETNISKGSVSVSNAAGEYIKQNVKDIQDKSILVIGAGKMGRATMRNIITELDTNEITLLNRT